MANLTGKFYNSVRSFTDGWLDSLNRVSHFAFDYHSTDNCPSECEWNLCYWVGEKLDCKQFNLLTWRLCKIGISYTYDVWV